MKSTPKTTSNLNKNFSNYEVNKKKFQIALNESYWKPKYNNNTIEQHVNTKDQNHINYYWTNENYYESTQNTVYQDNNDQIFQNNNNDHFEKDQNIPEEYFYFNYPQEIPLKNENLNYELNEYYSEPLDCTKDLLNDQQKYNENTNYDYEYYFQGNDTQYQPEECYEYYYDEELSNLSEINTCAYQYNNNFESYEEKNMYDNINNYQSNYLKANDDLLEYKDINLYSNTFKDEEQFYGKNMNELNNNFAKFNLESTPITNPLEINSHITKKEIKNTKLINCPKIDLEYNIMNLSNFLIPDQSQEELE